MKSKEKPKQETLEEAGAIAAGLCEHLEAKEQAMFIAGFQECAKWQQEQDKTKYSEKEVFKLISNFAYDIQIDEVKDIQDWFKQFKKK